MNGYLHLIDTPNVKDMTSTTNQERTNPAALAYLYPSMPLAVFSKIVSKYYAEEQRLFLDWVLEQTDSYAVPRALVPPSSRLRHAHRAFKVGRSLYYLLGYGAMGKRARIAARSGARILEYQEGSK